MIQIAGGPPIEADRCRVIAEAGANHNNDVAQAIELSREAANAGAWAVKFQLYKAETLTIRNSPKYWSDEFGTNTQFEAFKLLDQMPYEAWSEVADACKEFGIHFFATPFDLAAVGALENMHCPMYKIASADITNRPLIEAVAATNKPVFVSTGAAEVGEIEEALTWLDADASRVVPLVCTLKYPSQHRDGNFARIPTFQQRFAPLMIGYSDHTLGVAGGWVASSLGAVAIEKHYTLAKNLPDSPDHKMSVNPEELAELVSACDIASTLRGSADIGVSEVEQEARKFARRSLVIERTLEAGATISGADLGWKRPGTGISPARISDVLGRKLVRTVQADTVLTWDDLA